MDVGGTLANRIHENFIYEAHHRRVDLCRLVTLAVLCRHRTDVAEAVILAQICQLGTDAGRNFMDGARQRLAVDQDCLHP